MSTMVQKLTRFFPASRRLVTPADELREQVTRLGREPGQPREQHHAFAHATLPYYFYRKELRQDLDTRGGACLRALWELTAEALALPPEARLPGDALQLFRKAYGGARAIYYVALPAPERPGEAYFAALAFEQGPLRVFTLERSYLAEVDGQPLATIAWRYLDGNRGTIGERGYPQMNRLEASVLRHLGWPLM